MKTKIMKMKAVQMKSSSQRMSKTIQEKIPGGLLRILRMTSNSSRTVEMR